MGSPGGSSLPIHIIRESSRPRCVLHRGRFCASLFVGALHEAPAFQYQNLLKAGAHLSRKKTNVDTKTGGEMPSLISC